MLKGRTTRILSSLLIGLLATVVIFQALRSSNPGLVPIEGQNSAETLLVGGLSLRPRATQIVAKGPVCVVVLAVELRGSPWNLSPQNIFLLGQAQLYRPAMVRPISPETLFGQPKIRALVFHPLDLCARGPVRLADLALLVVHSGQIGILPLANPNPAAGE